MHVFICRVSYTHGARAKHCWIPTIIGVVLLKVKGYISSIEKVFIVINKKYVQVNYVVLKYIDF